MIARSRLTRASLRPVPCLVGLVSDPGFVLLPSIYGRSLGGLASSYHRGAELLLRTAMSPPFCWQKAQARAKFTTTHRTKLTAWRVIQNWNLRHTRCDTLTSSPAHDPIWRGDRACSEDFLEVSAPLVLQGKCAPRPNLREVGHVKSVDLR